MTEASAQQIASEKGFSKLLRIAKPTLPVCLGVAFANTCFNVTLNDNAMHFSDPLLQNGTLFIVIASMALFMVWLARRRTPLSSVAARIGVLWCIVGQVVSATGLGLLEYALSDASALRFACVALMYLSSLGALAFWLRCERYASAVTAAVVVFGAVLISEPFICFPALVSHVWAYVLLVFAGLAQALCLRVLPPHSFLGVLQERSGAEQDTNQKHSGGEPNARATGYFSLAETMADDKRLLIMTAVGVWMLSLAKAVIRVFPDGVAIPYTSTTLFLYFILSMVITAVLLRFALNENSGIMTVGIWLIMLNIAVLALLACGFFPDQLDIGLSLIYVLDVLLLAYTWYVALAFMHYGRQDPFYYVAGGLIAYLLPRSLTNVVMPLALGGIGHAVATTAVAAALLLLCAQYLFLQFPRPSVVEKAAEKKDNPLSLAAERAFGIEGPADTSTAMRVAIMQSHAARMQKQFLLSDREAEVLALYALGHTQDKIAGELFLSPGTVHTYMKRIYGKTSLHSRQAILDYLEHDAE